MRSALVCLLLLIAAIARSADIVILVHQSEAGPIVPQTDYEHPTWVLWPHSSLPSQGNRLLSLPSGVDWQTREADEKFEGLVNSQVNNWLKRGWEKAVKSNLGEPELFAIVPEPGEPSAWVLLAAMASPTQIKTLGPKDSWPAEALIVAEARGRNPWDRVAELVKKAGGRALILEVPENPQTMWSRFWLQGKGWPEGTPIGKSTRINGLLPARDLMALVQDPTKAKWNLEPAVPPNRWLGFGHDVSPVALVFLGVTAIYILGLGIYFALREQSSRVALILIRAMVAGPAVLLLGGQLTSLSLPSSWLTWHILALGIMIIAASIINRILAWRKLNFHPLWGEFATGALICGACDPVWSMFTNVLGPHRAPTSPEAFGALAAYFVGMMVLSPPKVAFRVPALVLIIGAVALTKTSGWLNGLSLSAVVLGQALGFLVNVPPENPSKTRLPLYPIGLAVGLICALWQPGLAYAPQGLVYTFAQFGKFNCAEQIAFLLSPTFISFCLVCIIAAIVGDNFLGHQARRAMAFSPMPKAFFPVALCFLVAGVFVPLYLHAFLAAALAGAVAVLFDAIRVP